MKISVVIPTWNRPDLLKLCLDALMQQDLNKDDYEIIIVTDGPDEMSQQLVTSLKKNFTLPLLRIISLKKKKGPAAARNMGWKNADAELIAFTDDDTRPKKYWLKEFIAAYNGEKEIAFTGKVIVPLSNRPTDYEKNIAHLETADFVTANCMCTKQALEKVNGFDEDFKMAWREDSDLHFKFLQEEISLKFLAGAIVLHPARSAKWGVSIKEQKKSMYNALLYKKHPLFYKQKIMADPLWNYYIIVFTFLMSLILFFLKAYSIAFAGLMIWLVMVVSLTYKRLRRTSHSVSHICEMLITSMIIPFLSVYWTLYGSWCFKVFFL